MAKSTTGQSRKRLRTSACATVPNFLFTVKIVSKTTFFTFRRDKATRRCCTNLRFRIQKVSMRNGANAITNLHVVIYVLSGVSQPLLMTLCKNAGLANSKAQLYMLFYYLGPTFLLLTLLPPGWCAGSAFLLGRKPGYEGTTDDEHRIRPSIMAIGKACVTALFDIAAQSLNYTGASMAGATIFAVIYSSVTVWTAVFSRLFLGRRLNHRQWIAVFVVFGGLCITAVDSAKLGDSITQGTVLILIGSCMHGATYVMSEAIMKVAGDVSSIDDDDDNSAIWAQQVNPNVRREKLSVRENAAIQGLVAFVGLLGWQFLYTAKRWDETIRDPMEASGTTVLHALLILSCFSVANLLHSFSFYHTLANYPGGSTSAGVMKGLQAVIVFLAAHFLYCGHAGGDGMCFSLPKFASLVTVVSGVVLFSASTEHRGGSREQGYSEVGTIEVVTESLTV